MCTLISSIKNNCPVIIRVQIRFLFRITLTLTLINSTIDRSWSGTPRLAFCWFLLSANLPLEIYVRSILVNRTKVIGDLSRLAPGRRGHTLHIVVHFINNNNAYVHSHFEQEHDASTSCMCGHSPPASILRCRSALVHLSPSRHFQGASPWWLDGTLPPQACLPLAYAPVEKCLIGLFLCVFSFICMLYSMGNTLNEGNYNCCRGLTLKKTKKLKEKTKKAKIVKADHS